jgi:NADH-quinone oxidoreductase subunit H
MNLPSLFQPYEFLLPYLYALLFAMMFPLVVGYLVLAERKLLADFQARLGPMRVGPHGILQPLADALKLILKEDLTPATADRFLFYLAPFLSVTMAMAAFAFIPFTEHIVITDANVGVLLLLGISAVGIFGLVLGGWSSNSHYSLLGSLRAVAQLVSYEVSLGLAAITAVMLGGSLSLSSIVQAQKAQGIWFLFGNYGFMILSFYVFLISAVAETNRAPFDLPEAESELIAGYHTEYSGFRFALYMLAEYANISLICCLAATLFLGGWLRPFPNVTWLEYPMASLVPAALCAAAIYGLNRMRLRLFIPPFGILALLFLWPAAASHLSPPFWFFLKAGGFFYLLIWFRATWPRFRYDQLMDIGWKRLIPLALFALFINAILGML